MAVFTAATVANLGDGRSTQFWTDSWLDGGTIRSIALAVHAAVPKRLRGTTVADALQGRAWVRQITGPHTMRVVTEFLSLWNAVEHVPLMPGVPDTFTWRFTADGVYSASSAYGAMFFGSSRPLGAKELWKTAMPPHVKHFFWLVLHERCWTANRRYRHGLQDSDICIFCDQASEMMDHIILGCVYNREV